MPIPGCVQVKIREPNGRVIHDSSMRVFLGDGMLPRPWSR